ncbi:MAG: hypothetical protein RL683_704 [Actinomycetota bacterium]|jgi:hypothetical protein
MNIPSSGLAMVVIAAIWFLVFLPSFVKRDERKVEEREKIERGKEITKTHLGEQATQAIAVKRGRATFATVAAVGAVFTVFSGLDFAATGRSLVSGLVALSATAVASVLAISLNRKYKVLLTSVATRQVPLTSPVAPVIKRANLTEKTNDFKPAEIPDQAYLKTGAIEIVELAEVVEISGDKETPKVESIDEIMRRRRHVG